MNETNHIYDDKKEQRFYTILFWIFELSMLLVTGSFLYASFLGVTSVIQKQNLTMMAYTPEVILSLLYMYGSYIGFKRAGRGKWISAVTMVVAVSSLVIVLLWVHLSKLA
jgi:hypothetical protein